MNIYRIELLKGTIPDVEGVEEVQGQNPYNEKLGPTYNVEATRIFIAEYGVRFYRVTPAGERYVFLVLPHQNYTSIVLTYLDPEQMKKAEPE